MGIYSAVCKIVAIAGPTASGKTTLASKLAKSLGIKNTVIITQDQYYKDWSKLSLKERAQINFDSPASFDFCLLEKQLRDLRYGKVIKAPCYSYRLHKRLKKTVIIKPKKWIIIDGLLLFCHKSIRDLFDFKVYIESERATSFARRIRRDLKHRGDTIESVCKRYFNDVIPMQEKYVEPQRKFADVVVDGNVKF